MNSKYEFSQDAIDNFMFIHAYWKNSCDGINAAPENKWGYKRGDIPFIDYLCEDKSKYPKASEGISYITNKPLYDPDDDFLLGNSGGILMNINFIVINIERLSRSADAFDEYGTYCDYDPSTPAYESFWQRETSRRKKGVIIKAKLYYKDIPKFFDKATTDEERDLLLKPMRITGAHYTYLNYGRIERTPNAREREKLKREGAEHVETVMGFPRYWDGDYWNFKIDEFIANNKFHLTKAKARRKGFSYKRGSQAANTINLFPNVTVTLAADQLAYLTDKGATTFMAKKCLDHFEEHTFWKRGYISEAIDDILMGYRVSTKGLKNFGWLSNLYSVAIGKNESAAVGKKAIEIDFEEAGKCPNLQKALDVTLSNTESGAISVGTIRVYGTGGTKGANWAAFSKAFYNPKMNKMLCMENVWDINKRHEVCGFFFPQVWDCEPYVERGNSIIFTAYAWDKQDKENHFHNNDSETHIIYKAQRANTPAEAFINTTENMFASPELNLHVSDLINDNATRFFQDGWIVVNDLGGENRAEFIPRAECIKRDIFGKGKFHEFVNQVPHGSRDDTHGCVRMYYRPFLINGEVPKDLYFTVVDAYKVDKAQKDVTDKHSLYSAQVWMRSNTITPYPNQKLLVCEYIGRMDTMEQNDIVTMGMCLLYNAECCPEAGTGETVSNFIKYKLRRYLMLDPTNMNSRKLVNPNNNDYGIVIGDGDKKYNGLRMLKEFIYEPLSYTDEGNPIRRLKFIGSVRLLLECQRFTAEGNFDHISAAIVAMYVFLADSLNTKRLVEGNKEDNSRRIANRLNRR
nr:MAG TPA: Terminase large subunit [Crassvirales sp.]